MGKIFELLPEGQENAVSRKNLMIITGLNDRELRRAIAAERREGCLIFVIVRQRTQRIFPLGKFRRAPAVRCFDDETRQGDLCRSCSGTKSP